jgi:hypothetical protein
MFVLANDDVLAFWERRKYENHVRVFIIDLFPFLYNSGVTDKQSCLQLKPNRWYFTKFFYIKLNNYCYSVIDTFRKIYYLSVKPTLYISNGVRAITMFIERPETFKYPLKICLNWYIYANTPLMLHNPGLEATVVRLYCKIYQPTWQKKIPVMSESVINKIVKEINKKQPRGYV